MSTPKRDIHGKVEEEKPTEEPEYIPTAKDNFDDLMILKDNTWNALDSLLTVVKKIKADHYDSEDDELDRELSTVEEAIEAIAEII